MSALPASWGVATAWADSVAHVAGGVPMTLQPRALVFPPNVITEQFIRFVESWHEFFLLAGTAAVTLAGLLFVAISLHLEVLLHGRRAHLLDMARQTLLAFLYVLIVSLMFLVPPSTPRLLAGTLGGATLVVTGFSLAGLIKELRANEARQMRRVNLRRRFIQIVALSLALLGVWGLAHGDGVGTFLLIGPLCMLLGNATGTAWTLLVELGRLKASDAEAEPRR